MRQLLPRTPKSKPVLAWMSARSKLCARGKEATPGPSSSASTPTMAPNASIVDCSADGATAPIPPAREPARRWVEVVRVPLALELPWETLDPCADVLPPPPA